MTEHDLRQACSTPLLVIALASTRLKQDLEVFAARWPYSQKGLVTAFLRSTSHHVVILLRHSLAIYNTRLQQHHDLPAAEKYFKGRLISMKDLLKLAHDRLSYIQDALEVTLEKLSMDKSEFQIVSGMAVPTSSPRELLIRLLIHHPISQAEMASAGVRPFLASIGSYLKLPSTPLTDGKEFVLSEPVADGTPKMFFICCHGFNGNNASLYVGACQPDWSGLEAVAEIRRADRDHQLERYIPSTTQACNALQKAEENAVLPNSMQSLTGNPRLFQIRRRAIVEMKDGPHPSFLGRTTELGQAFDNTGKACQCCYACQGMMGYQVATTFKEKQVKGYLCHFQWELRDGYSHSCAEIKTSLQCSINWLEHGKTANH